MPAPLETKLTPAVPAKLPALAVFSDTPSALLDAPAASPVIEPEPANPALTAPKPALSRSVKMSGETLVTPRAATGAASPTRAASVIDGGTQRRVGEAIDGAADVHGLRRQRRDAEAARAGAVGGERDGGRAAARTGARGVDADDQAGVVGGLRRRAG